MKYLFDSLENLNCTHKHSGFGAGLSTFGDGSAWQLMQTDDFQSKLLEDFNLFRVMIHCLLDSPEDTMKPMEVFSVLKSLKSKNPDIKIIGAIQSPPAWMKTNLSLNGGHLSAKHVDEYAKYIVSTCNLFKTNGVELYGISLQNEPWFEEKWPSCQYTTSEYPLPIAPLNNDTLVII